MLTKRKLLKRIEKLEKINKETTISDNAFEGVKDFFESDYSDGEYGYSFFPGFRSRGMNKLEHLLKYLGIEFFTIETKNETKKGYRKIKKTGKKK